MSTSPAAEAPPAPVPEVHPPKAEEPHETEQAETQKPAEDQETKPSPAEENVPPSPSESLSEGEYSGSDTSERESPADEAQPPLPNEPLPSHDGPPLPNEPLPGTDSAAPPLPAEPVPEQPDDGWEFHWNANDQSYWFYNRFTGVWQQENPRLANTTTATTSTPAAAAATVPTPADKTSLSNPTSVAGGYNPAIHGSYDENAWYAQNLRAPATDPSTSTALTQQQQEEYASAGFFNRHTGQWQDAEQGVERHTDEAKSRRQMRAYFDVDAAANMHDGRSLKAERAGKKPSRSELKAFKERRRAKKEEKRRAWLRD